MFHMLDSLQEKKQQQRARKANEYIGRAEHFWVDFEDRRWIKVIRQTLSSFQFVGHIVTDEDRISSSFWHFPQMKLQTDNGVVISRHHDELWNVERHVGVNGTAVGGQFQKDKAGMRVTSPVQVSGNVPPGWRRSPVGIRIGNGKGNGRGNVSCNGLLVHKGGAKSRQPGDAIEHLQHHKARASVADETIDSSEGCQVQTQLDGIIVETKGAETFALLNVFQWLRSADGVSFGAARHHLDASIIHDKVVNERTFKIDPCTIDSGP
mmetsp:Transcript_4079/g.8382  ORF Transcript_4079/g.8382 Transcript_4079/m.8382 type:complete len:265 (-) Transcript_4079:378-1172(-)